MRSLEHLRAFGVVAALAAGAAHAADDPPELKANRIEVRYVEPKTADLQPVFKLLTERKALEKIRDLLAPIRLPRTLILQTMSCDGAVNAWYQDGKVTVCYELADDIWRNAAREKTPAGIAPLDTMIGPFVSVMLHESGHAFFDLLKVPVLGGEETAADEFASYFLLQFEDDETRRLVAGSAYQYREDVLSPTVTTALKQFSDEHGTPAQRFYNLLCMAYGADQKLFADVVTAGYLPKARADRCPAEYARVANAIAALIGPHVDLALAAQQPRRWLAPADTQVPHSP